MSVFNFVFLLLAVLLSVSDHTKCETQTRIVGGFRTHIANFPFIVSLQLFNHHMCGGAIISPKYIVTAAHCFDCPDYPYTIKAGVDDLKKQGVQIDVKKIIIHPNYNEKSFTYDVAVLELEKPLKFINKKIQKIKLPRYSTMIPLKLGTVMGWGETNRRDERTNVLRAVHLPVYKKEKCNQVDIFKITESMFCAGYEYQRKDSCIGDSGGPFVIGNVLYGVVSYGSSQCGNGYPGVYTRIPFVVKWIKSVAGIKE